MPPRAESPVKTAVPTKKSSTHSETRESSMMQQDQLDIKMVDKEPEDVAECEDSCPRTAGNEARNATNASKHTSRASSPTKEKASRATVPSTRLLAGSADKMQNAPESFLPESTRDQTRIKELERESSSLKLEMNKLSARHAAAIAEMRSEFETKSAEEGKRHHRQVASLKQIVSECEHECKIKTAQAQEDVNTIYRKLVDSNNVVGQWQRNWAAMEKGQRDQLEEMKAKYEHELSSLKKTADYHQQMSQQKKEENEKLRERVGQQEASVTKAQNAAINVLSQSLSAKLPDDRIRQRFHELFEGIAEWARENATQDVSMLEDPKTVLQWQKDGLLRTVGNPGDSPNLEFDLKHETAADTLLNAALARFLCQDFLKNPFFFAEHLYPIVAVSLPKEQRLETGTALRRLLNSLQKKHEGNEVEVHAWRAATVKALTGSTQAQRQIQTWYKDYMEGQLIKDCQELIRRDVQEEDMNELLQIIKGFGNFAIELWSQRCNVRYYCLNHFEKKAYRYGDDELEIARAVGLDEGDTSLDGRPIPVLVQPLIVGFGTVDGRDYDKSRIWSRAVVWVSKDGKPPTTPIAAKSRRWAFKSLQV